MKKVFVGAMIIFIGGLSYWFMYGSPSDNIATIEFIQNRIYNGEIIDLQQDLKVKDIDDIRWYEKKGNIIIEYGSVMLKYPVSEFVKDEVQADLNTILITTKQNGSTLEFRLYFKGEEIPKYVKRSLFDFI